MTNLGWVGLNTGAPGSGGASAVEIGDGGGKIGETSNLGSGNNGTNHCNCPLNQTEQEYAVVNDWTRDIGRHSIKFGAEIRRLQELRIPSDVNRTGQLQFADERTATASGSTPGGIGIASLMFGDVSTISRYFSTSTTATEHQYRPFFYVQDNWKVSPKLTLNLGLRYEIYFPEAVNGKGMGGFYDLNTNTVRVAGYGNIGMNLNIQNNFNYFAPRVGFAYQMLPRTVVRAGYGRAFDPGFFGDIFGQLVTQTIPVLQNQGLGQLDGELYDAARNLDGSVYNIATGPTAPSNQYNIPANGQLPLPAGIYPTSRPDRMRIPEVDGWNLTIQQQLGATTSFTLAYVGNKSTHSITSIHLGRHQLERLHDRRLCSRFESMPTIRLLCQVGHLWSRVHRLLRERGECPLQLVAGHLRKALLTRAADECKLCVVRYSRRRQWHLLPDRSPRGMGAL